MLVWNILVSIDIKVQVLMILQQEQKYQKDCYFITSITKKAFTYIYMIIVQN